MNNKELYIDVISRIQPSENVIERIMDMTNQKKKFRPRKSLIAVLVVIGIIVLIIKYKSKGLLAGISFIGLSAIYLLLVRYANVVISVESIFGIAIILILNFIFTFMLLDKIENNLKENKENAVNKATVETYKKFFDRIIPICIMVVAFCFIKWIPISSFGMISFWGLVMIVVYNAVITRSLLNIKEDNK